MADPNYARLFREAVEDSQRDWYNSRSHLMTEGYWQIKLIGRTRPWIPARTWRCNHEPGNPENIMDRTYLAAEIAGEWADPLDVFGTRARRPLTAHGGLSVEQEYNFRVADLRHAQAFRPRDPLAQPRRAIDLTKMDLLF